MRFMETQKVDACYADLVYVDSKDNEKVIRRLLEVIAALRRVTSQRAGARLTRRFMCAKRSLRTAWRF